MTYLQNIRKEIIDAQVEIVSTRRHLHMHPELSGKEHKTQEFIIKFLEKEGIKCSKLADTGVIATIGADKSGKVIGLRADIDALPVNEENDHHYTSKTKGVMHACGHDGHTAILLHTAQIIKRNESKLKGPIRLIFQPAEENIGGAKRMIEAGCLKNPNVEEIYGLHLWGSYPTGEIRTKAGAVMATNGEIVATIEGKSGHGAMPHHTIDSIVVAAQFINNVQTVISRNLSPFASSVITFGKIEGGTAPNVIAPKVTLTGTVRSLSDEDKAFIVKRIDDVLKGTCLAHGAKGELIVDYREAYPALINDHHLTEKIIKHAHDLVTEDNVRDGESMGSEDFAYYAREIPGCFFFVGAGNLSKGIIHPQHHSKFDIDDHSLLIGIEMFLRICEI